MVVLCRRSFLPGYLLLSPPATSENNVVDKDSNIHPGSMDGSTYLTGRPQLANLYLLLLPPTPTPSQQILLIYQSSAISYPLPGSQVKSKTCVP